MSVKKKYDLSFTYTDNDQVYSDCLELTDAEVTTIESALQHLVGAGYIQNPDDSIGIKYMLIPYSEPVFISLNQLKQNWKDGSLGQVLEDFEFTWESSTDSALTPVS